MSKEYTLTRWERAGSDKGAEKLNKYLKEDDMLLMFKKKFGDGQKKIKIFAILECMNDSIVEHLENIGPFARKGNVV